MSFVIAFVSRGSVGRVPRAERRVGGRADGAEVLPRGKIDWFFFNSLGDDAKQVFSLFVDADGINYGKKMYLDTCHSYFYDGCCEQRGIGG